MKYAAYNEYQPSGSNWLDAVPLHWNVKPLKLIVKIPITDGPHETPEFIPDGVPFASVEAIWDGKVHLSSVRGYISEDDHGRYSKKYHPKKDDIFIVKSGSTTGKIAIVDFDDDFNVWSPLAAVRCDASQACPEFVFYALCSSYFQRLVQVSWSFGTQPNIGMGVLGNLPAVLPPLLEQQTIARFLDAKTAQIDALVAQKRQLIAKLKEKRSALIARTVTRGLPPEAAKAAGLEPHPEMKNSGVDWLGVIPAHWVTPPLYARYSVELGKMLSEAKITGEHLIPYLRNVDVQWNFINYQDLPEMDIPPAEHLRYTIRTGDLLVCEGGEVGRAAIIGKFDGVIGYQKALHRLRALRDDEDQRFMCFILEWAAQTGVFNAGGMSTIAHLTGEQLRKYRFPKPPKNEQQVIVKYLQRETDKIVHLQREVETAIARLTEYRQAIITSAVTGKIDVRDWQSELEAA